MLKSHPSSKNRPFSTMRWKTILYILKVASYIETRTGTGQEGKGMNVIVISLKDEFYSHADGLIGVCPDNTEGENADCLVSKVMSVDLTKFPKENVTNP